MRQAFAAELRRVFRVSTWQRGSLVGGYVVACLHGTRILPTDEFALALLETTTGEVPEAYESCIYLHLGFAHLSPMTPTFLPMDCVRTEGDLLFVKALVFSDTLSDTCWCL